MIGFQGSVTVDVTLSRERYEAIQRLADRTGQGLSEVIGKSFLLYESAIEAQRAGKFVGFADEEGVFETVFVGLEGAKENRAEKPRPYAITNSPGWLTPVLIAAFTLLGCVGGALLNDVSDKAIDGFPTASAGMACLFAAGFLAAIACRRVMDEPDRDNDDDFLKGWENDGF